MTEPDQKSSATGASADIRKTLDAFLLAALKASEALAHERATPLDEIARELGISDRLAEKIAAFLEGEGLVDYDDQAIDITIDGMLRAQETLRGGDRSEARERAEAKPSAAKNGEAKAAESRRP